jgi:thiol-disulfide isomerase/thioredoxin
MATSYKSRINSRSSIKSSKSSKGTESSNGIWLVLGLLVLLIIIVIVVGGFYKRFEKFTNPSNFTLKYFYMESCGHCKDFNSVWDKLQETIKNTNVEAVKYDIRDNEIGTKEAEFYEVKGAPTIILVDNKKKFYEYNGNRTLEDIKKFIDDKTK